MTVVPVTRASGTFTRSRAGKAMKKTTKEAATALVRPGIQKRKRPAKRAAVPKAAAGKRPASASEGAAVPKAAAAGKTLAEASFILKLKEEAYGAQDLWWKHMDAPVGALDRWVKAKEKEAKAEEAQPKKTKMVVKTRLPREFIDFLRMQQPALLRDYPDEDFGDESDEPIRHLHAMLKYMNSKMYDYHQALIDQYISQGYADDEDEVTTDGEPEN